jgi:hypothetical protein
MVRGWCGRKSGVGDTEAASENMCHTSGGTSGLTQVLGPSQSGIVTALVSPYSITCDHITNQRTCGLMLAQSDDSVKAPALPRL